MSSGDDPVASWWSTVADANSRYAALADETMTAQSRFVDAWLDAIDDATEQDRLDESASAVATAYEVWMDAADDTVEQATDMLEGEDVPVERFRDTWLNAANRAFKETMETSAFAHATGQATGDVLELRQQYDEVATETLHELGLPAERDIEEVGERLVELERRQHAVEQRLDRILDALDER
jgi:hypothetical protein